MNKLATPRKLNSMKQASIELGIPLDQVKIIKQFCPEAFSKNNSLNVEQVKKYYADNKALIEGIQAETKQTLEKKKLANDIIIQELKIANLRKETVNLQDVSAFFAAFGIEVSAVLKNKIVKELPVKITGNTEEQNVTACKEVYNELIKLIEKNTKEWAKTYKSKTND